MNERQVDGVASVLAQWNPLGAATQGVPDLDGYRVEAADIIFGLKLRGRSVRSDAFVAWVLNDAFDLSVNVKTCSPHAKEIVAILQEKRSWPADGKRLGVAASGGGLQDTASVTGNSAAFARPMESAGAKESVAGWRRRALSSSGA